MSAKGTVNWPFGVSRIASVAATCLMHSTAMVAFKVLTCIEWVLASPFGSPMKPANLVSIKRLLRVNLPREYTCGWGFFSSWVPCQEEETTWISSCTAADGVAAGAVAPGAAGVPGAPGAASSVGGSSCDALWTGCDRKIIGPA